MIETIEMVESQNGWTAKPGPRVLFTDTFEDKPFRAALAISNPMFDDGLSSQLILIRLQS